MRTTTSRTPDSTYPTAPPPCAHRVRVTCGGCSAFATERRRELSAFASQRRKSPFASVRQYARRPLGERSVVAGLTTAVDEATGLGAVAAGAGGRPSVVRTSATTVAPTIRTAN